MGKSSEVPTPFSRFGVNLRASQTFPEEPPLLQGDSNYIPKSFQTGIRQRERSIVSYMTYVKRRQGGETQIHITRHERATAEQRRTAGEPRAGAGGSVQSVRSCTGLSIVTCSQPRDYCLFHVHGI